jgi:acyl-CoA dehydrogenase
LSPPSIWQGVAPICRAYADARVVKIAGGSIEVMKMIISREMFKGRLQSSKTRGE